jgi:hypothetical protein
VPGLGVSDAVAFAPAGKDGGDAVVLGAVRGSANNSTLLSSGLIKAAGTLPDRQAVAIGDGLQAYRYRNLRLSGFSRPVTVYAVPTTAGVATLACLGGAATCDPSANTMALVSAKGFPVGPSADYGKAVSGALATLGKAQKSGQAKLKSAKTPDAQASAAQSLSAATSKAASTIGGLKVSPADALVNSQLVTALKSTAKAYGSAAKAAKQHDKAAFAKAGKTVSTGQKDIAKALAGLKAAGYDVKS